MKNLTILIFCAVLTISVTFYGCNNSDDKDEPQAEICNNGLDDDKDGFIDCQDNDCSTDAQIECACDDGMDNDGDGFTDSEDSDC